MAIFFTTARTLFFRFSIIGRFCGCLVDLFYDLTDSRIDFFVAHYLLCGIDEKQIHSAFDGYLVLLPAVALAYPPFKEITLHGSFEELLGYRYHNTVETCSRPLETNKAHSGHTAVLAFGKEHGNVCLAAQSFLLGKSIAGLSVHF